MKTKTTIEKLATALGRKLNGTKELVLANSSRVQCQPIVVYYLAEDGKFRSVVYDPCRPSDQPAAIHRSAASLDKLITLTGVAIEEAKGCGHLHNAWKLANLEARATMHEIAALKALELV